jgi:hypothetical protein
MNEQPFQVNSLSGLYVKTSTILNARVIDNVCAELVDSLTTHFSILSSNIEVNSLFDDGNQTLVTLFNVDRLILRVLL